LRWDRSRMISPAGSQSAPVTWWRGAVEAEGVFASICDISSFPTADMWNCQSTWRGGSARTAAAPRRGRPSENNSTNRNRGPACALNRQRRVECPPAPNPSPIRRETLARVRCRGLPLWTVVHNRQREVGRTACDEMRERATHAGLASAPGWRTSPFGTKPGALLYLNCDRNTS
jgi:hypothetical protein